LTLPEAVDEQHVECDIVLTQLSQETQDAEEPSFVASNETILNMKPVCGSVSVGDGVAETEFISSVNPQAIATGFTLDVDMSFIESEFMPKYEATFGDKRVKDSTDDRLVPELCNKDKTLLQRALAEHALEMPDCQNLSQAYRVVADGFRFNDNVSLINHDNVIIRKGIIFKTMDVMKIWLTEYAVFHHRLASLSSNSDTRHR
jgi:hypothetical protein